MKRQLKKTPYARRKEERIQKILAGAGFLLFLVVYNYIEGIPLM